MIQDVKVAGILCEASLEMNTARIENMNVDSTNTTMKEKLENTFITLTDFIFYDGTIKGMTFDELTDTAKQEILDLYEKIDSKKKKARAQVFFPHAVKSEVPAAGTPREPHGKTSLKARERRRCFR